MSRSSRGWRPANMRAAPFGRRVPCPVFECQGTRSRHHFCCQDCWGFLPADLRARIVAEREQCRLAGIAHSQELLELRDQAVEYLNRKYRERAAARDSQPDLFPQGAPA